MENSKIFWTVIDRCMFPVCDWQVYISSVWLAGVRFRCMIDDAWWTGTIAAISAFQAEYPDSMFQCLQVQWVMTDTVQARGSEYWCPDRYWQRSLAGTVSTKMF